VNVEIHCAIISNYPRFWNPNDPKLCSCLRLYRKHGRVYILHHYHTRCQSCNTENKRENGRKHYFIVGVMMKEKLSSIVSVFSAFIMAGCCLGPLILIPLGLTSEAGTLAIFSTKYQTYLMISTLIFLAVSFYYVYGRGCKKRNSIILLWISTVLVLGMFVYTIIAKGYLNGVISQ
jgi:mercuric ion transport protein